MTKREILINLFWIGIVIFFAFRSCNQQNKIAAAQSITDDLTDQFHATTNLLGQEKDRYTAIMMTVDYLQKAHVNDSLELIRFKKIIDRQTISATIIQNLMRAPTRHSKTTVVLLPDSFNLPRSGINIPKSVIIGL